MWARQATGDGRRRKLSGQKAGFAAVSDYVLLTRTAAGKERLAGVGWPFLRFRKQYDDDDDDEKKKTPPAIPSHAKRTKAGQRIPGSRGQGRAE